MGSRRFSRWLAGAVVIGVIVAGGVALRAEEGHRNTPTFRGGLDPQALWPYGDGGEFLGHVMQTSASSVEVRSFDGRWTVEFVLPQADGRDALAAQIRNTLVGEFVEIQWQMVDDQPTLRAIIRAR